MATKDMQPKTSTTRSDMNFRGFDQVSEGVKDAFGEFKKLQDSEEFSAAIGMLKPVTRSVRRAASFTADYARRHPVRIALTVAALGIVAFSLTRNSEKPMEELH